ncbi:MAG: hypothetical protein AAGC91_05515 [Pseudomonadota bacterium]
MNSCCRADTWKLVAPMILAVAACGADEPGASGARAIEVACSTNTNMPQEACKCLASSAGENLSDPAAEWLAAAMSGKTEEALKLKEGVPWPELVEASTFMMNFAEDCAIPEAALEDMQ